MFILSLPYRSNNTGKCGPLSLVGETKFGVVKGKKPPSGRAHQRITLTDCPLIVWFHFRFLFLLLCLLFLFVWSIRPTRFHSSNPFHSWANWFIPETTGIIPPYYMINIRTTQPYQIYTSHTLSIASLQFDEPKSSRLRATRLVNSLHFTFINFCCQHQPINQYYQHIFAHSSIRSHYILSHLLFS